MDKTTGFYPVLRRSNRRGDIGLSYMWLVHGSLTSTDSVRIRVAPFMRVSYKGSVLVFKAKDICSIQITPANITPILAVYLIKLPTKCQFWRIKP